MLSIWGKNNIGDKSFSAAQWLEYPFRIEPKIVDKLGGKEGLKKNLNNKIIVAKEGGKTISNNILVF